METLLLFVCMEFKVKVKDDKTEITGLTQAEIFMEIAWMYYGQGKIVSCNEKQSYESSSKAGRETSS